MILINIITTRISSMSTIIITIRLLLSLIILSSSIVTSYNSNNIINNKQIPTSFVTVPSCYHLNSNRIYQCNNNNNVPKAQQVVSRHHQSRKLIKHLSLFRSYTTSRLFVTPTSTISATTINNNDNDNNDNNDNNKQKKTSTLNHNEISRYSRHLVLNDVGIIGQEKLKNSSILMIGAGGLGSSCLLYLAAAGIGYIGIIDNDIVDESNLQRQIIHNIHTVGISKCQSAKQTLLNINPNIQVQLYETEFTSQTAISIISNGFSNERPNWDVVIDGSDNFPTKYLINDICSMYNIPWVYSAILAFEGQVSVFNYNNGPDYRDLIPIPPPPGEVPSCAEGGVIGVLPGTMGCIQATEAMKLILYGTHNNHNNNNNNNNNNNIPLSSTSTTLSKVDILSGRVLIYDALKMKFSEIHLQRDPYRIPITSLIDYQGFCGGPQTIISPSAAATTTTTTTTTTAAIMPIDNSMLGQRTMDEANDYDTQVSSFNSIEPNECLQKMINNEWTPYVIDVRLQTEHDIVALPFTDSVIPYRTIHSQRDIPIYGDILIYCKGGIRGKKACQSLIQQGIDSTRLYNLNGGIMKWQKDIDQSMPRY